MQNCFDHSKSIIHNLIKTDSTLLEQPAERDPEREINETI